MYMNHWWGFGGWGVLGGLLMALFWVLVVIAVVFLVRWLAEPGRVGGGMVTQGGRSPLDVLMERYARGEITRDQYLQMRQDLGV